MDHYIMMTTSVVYLYNMLIPEIHDFLNCGLKQIFNL